LTRKCREGSIVILTICSLASGLGSAPEHDDEDHDDDDEPLQSANEDYPMPPSPPLAWDDFREQMQEWDKPLM
jgi:hypothetical protein